MDKKLIEEINALAKKQREGTLTEEEKERQAKLRKMYIDEFKANFRKQLENIEFVDEDKNAH